MSRNGRGACELRVAVHTAESIGETVGSRTCSHVIRVKGTTGTAAGCYGEVLLAGLSALLLVGACNRMLETGRVRGVTGDGNVYVLLPHDCYAFRNGVSAVAVNLSAKTVGVGVAADFLNRVGVRIVLGLYMRETVDTADDLSGILAETVEDNAERLLTNLVCLLGDTDSTLSSSEGLVTCEECEAVRLLLEEHLAEVTMAETNLAGVGNGARDTESLKTLADCSSSVSSLAAVLLDCDGSAYGVSPASVLKADRLNLLNLIVNVQAGVLGDLLRLFDGGDAIAVQNGIDLVNSSFIRFK